MVETGHLEAMRGFLKGAPVDQDPHGILHELVIGWYDEVTEKASKAAHKLRVAVVVTTLEVLVLRALSYTPKTGAEKGIR